MLDFHSCKVIDKGQTKPSLPQLGKEHFLLQELWAPNAQSLLSKEGHPTLLSNFNLYIPPQIQSTELEPGTSPLHFLYFVWIQISHIAFPDLCVATLKSWTSFIFLAMSTYYTIVTVTMK